MHSRAVLAVAETGGWDRGGSRTCRCLRSSGRIGHVYLDEVNAPDLPPITKPRAEWFDRSGVQTEHSELALAKPVAAVRHGHAVALYEAGLDLAGISRQLGHAKISTTAIYLQGLGVDLEKVAALAF